MRAAVSLAILVSASTVLVACSDTSGPEPPTPPIVVLTVAPNVATIDGGRFLKLTAKVLSEDGRVTIPSDVIWSSSNETVASVAAGGLVQAREPGEAKILAVWRSARGSARVIVRRPPKEPPDDPVCLKRLPPASANSIPKC